MPLDVVHGLLVTGDSYGICLTEEKGQRAFNKSYIDPPNPNHLIYSRESGTTGFLVIEGERTDHVAPAPVSDPKAEAGDEAGDIVLSWTCTADDTREGAKALGYRVYLSTEELTTERLNDKTLLPRHLTYRPKEPGTRQGLPNPQSPTRYPVSLRGGRLRQGGQRLRSDLPQGNSPARRGRLCSNRTRRTSGWAPLVSAVRCGSGRAPRIAKSTLSPATASTKAITRRTHARVTTEAAMRSGTV